VTSELLLPAENKNINQILLLSNKSQHPYLEPAEKHYSTPVVIYPQNSARENSKELNRTQNVDGRAL